MKSRNDIKRDMNEAMEFIEDLRLSNSMWIDEFVDARADNDSIENGVDMEAVRRNMEEGAGLSYIPVKILKKEYDIEPVCGRLETKDGSLSMGGSSDFYFAAQEILREVSDWIENSYGHDISMDAAS
ncbi:MAG: hypothetical protein K5770_15840 [Lachnospiraceae bacterium]|nr:hypothetical protein [Lachnospiraceae bacterium]